MKKVFTLIAFAFVAMSMNAKMIVPLTNGIEGIDENGIMGDSEMGVLYTYDAVGWSWWCNDITGYKYLQVTFDETSTDGAVGFENGDWEQVSETGYTAGTKTVTIDVTEANNTCPAILFYSAAGSTVKVAEVAFLTENEVENAGGTVVFDPTAEKYDIPTTFSNIDENGIVTGTIQAELYDAVGWSWWRTDASAYDFMVMTVEESTANGVFSIYKDDWATSDAISYQAGDQYVVFDLNNSAAAEWKANFACVVIETEVGSTLKIHDLAYMNGVAETEGIEGAEIVSNQQTPIYNLAGQRVGTAKGIIIKNGKKYIVK